jgi:hypothetical protein
MKTYSNTTIDDPFIANYIDDLSINDSGQIAGSYYYNDVYHSFLYSGGSYTTMDDPCESMSCSGEGWSAEQVWR